MKNPIPTVIIALVLLVFISFMMTGKPPVESTTAPISDVIGMVEDGKVATVTISGPNVRVVTTDKKTVVSYENDHQDFKRALHDHHVQYREEPPSSDSPILSIMLIVFVPLLFAFIILRWLSRQAGGQMGKLNAFGASRARKYVADKDRKTFADVAGIDEAVADVRGLVDFLKDPKRFQKLGGRIPKGVLLVGESGCGKTLLARAVAGEAGVPFFAASATGFVEMFVGVGASRVRDLFETAGKHAPCIIFIDELDAIGKKRGGLANSGGHDEREQTLNQILIEMDGFEPNKGVIVIAATNRPETLDSALVRSGRFDRHVVVPRPDIKGREAILRVYAKSKAFAEDVDLSVVARGTTGMSGADLEKLLNEAALDASSRGAESIAMADIINARDKIVMGPERKSVVKTDEEKRVTAYHECGHAIVGWLTPAADPVHRVTIVSRGMALGMTQFLPTEDRKLHSKEYMLAKISSLYGGRVAEELYIGKDKITSGASNDYAHLTAIARQMVTDYAMGDIGQRVFGQKERGFVFEEHAKDYSEETARQIDREIKRITDDCYWAVRDLLIAKAPEMNQLAALLIEYETIDDLILASVLGPRPTS